MKNSWKIKVGSIAMSVFMLITMLPAGAFGAPAQPDGKIGETGAQSVQNVAQTKPALTIQAGTNQKPTKFTWTASGGSEKYELKIRNGAGVEVKYLTNLTTNSYTLKLSAGVYDAAVAAVGSDASVTWSGYMPFTVQRDTLLALNIASLPDKTTYLEGDPFDPAGMRVTGDFLSGYSGEITDYEVSGYSPTPGTHTISVSYEEFTITFDVTVSAKALTKIAVTKLPNKVAYLEGEPFDATGMEVTAYYNNNTTSVVKASDYTVTGYASTPGSHTVSVTHGGKTTSFVVSVTARQIQSIAVTKKPDKLSYKEGEAFSQAGMEVTAYYNNGASATVSGYTVSGYASTPGTHTITVAYSGKTATFSVTVSAKALTGIAVTKKPAKLTYKEGEAFDPAGMEVTASYDNNTTAVVTGYTVTGYASVPGAYTITVAYGGKTATFPVTVTAKVLVSIAVTKLPGKLAYKEGQAFDPTGLEVTATYDNGTSEVVRSYTLSGYASTPGTHTITVTLGSKTTQFNVTVTARRLTKIEITKNPLKLQYKEGDFLDLEGLQVTALYDNGDADVVTDYTVSGYASTPGVHVVTVAYSGKTATFSVTVAQKVLMGISITKAPAKLQYKEGEPLDLTGLEVTASYDNYTSALVEDYTVSGYTSTPGTHTVTVTYGGKKASFDVKVTAKQLQSIGVTKKPAKLTYKEGEAFSQTGLEVTAYYDNGASAAVTGYTVTGYASTPGTHTITVTYNGKTATFDVTVTAKVLTGITITKQPAKIAYLEGDDFDPAGMEVTATYDNGTSAVVTGYTTSGYSPAPGTHTITVAYGGKEAAFQVVVSRRTLTRIGVTKKPTKLTYKEGESFHSDGMEVTAYYDNGATEPVEGYTLSGYASTPGIHTITVTYNGKTTTFNVTVTAKQVTEIKVTKMPVKLSYKEGEAFSQEGMEVTAYYDNGTSAVVTGFTITGYSSAPGTHTVTVAYIGKTATFGVTVNPKQLQSIAVTKQPTKLSYKEGETLDTTGMVVTGYYDNSTSAPITGYTLSGYASTPGRHTVTVTFGGKTATFEVTVAAKALTGITIPVKPEKLSYKEGEELSLTGMEVTAVYDNGTSETVTGYSVSGYASTPGTHTITVAYGGKTATFQVTVTKKLLTELVITKLPTKLSYKEGDTLDLTGLVVTGFYEDSTYKEIKNYTVSGYSPAAGKHKITVSFDGKTADFEVTVEEKKLLYIEIAQSPDKLEYMEGEALDTKGLRVTAHYDNGTAENVTDFEVVGYNGLPGAWSVTVNYQGRQAAFSVTVRAKQLLGIVIRSQPNKLIYKRGEAFDPAGMVVAAQYDNGAELVVGDYMITGYNSALVGRQKLTVTYNGKTEYIYVEVKVDASDLKPAIEATTVMGKKNDIVTVQVNLKDNPGIIAMGFYMEYDSDKMELVGVKDPQLFGSKLSTSMNYKANPYRIYWDGSVDTDSTETGLLVEFQFKILMDNLDGDRTPVIITYNEYDIIDSNLDSVTFEVVNGLVILKSKMKGDVDGNGDINSVDIILLRRYYLGRKDREIEFENADIDGDGNITMKDITMLRRYLAGWPGVFSVNDSVANAASVGNMSFGSASGHVGDTVTIAVNVAGNPGLIGASIPLNYDGTRLALVSVEDTGLLLGGNYMSKDYTMNPYKLYWEDALAGGNNRSNGIIAYLTFRILEDAPAGDAQVTANAADCEFINYNLDDVPFQFNAGVITVQ